MVKTMEISVPNFDEEISVTARQLIRKLIITVFCGCLLVGSTFADTDGKVVKDLSEDEISSFGCLFGGIGLFTAGYVAGPSEAIMLWGGGLLVPSGNSVLAISMLGALGAAGCSIGASLAPTISWLFEQVDRFFLYASSSIN
ncbi:membrane hypothetical protein [Gammaproteobacteria bacterium]